MKKIYLFVLVAILSSSQTYSSLDFSKLITEYDYFNETDKQNVKEYLDNLPISERKQILINLEKEVNEIKDRMKKIREETNENDDDTLNKLTNELFSLDRKIFQLFMVRSALIKIGLYEGGHYLPNINP